MEVRVRNDTVEIVGYVNAIERKSKPLRSRTGEFVERICKGAFKRAIERNNNIRLLLNHDWKKDLGGTDDGTLELREDNIGLKARAVISDAEVIEAAKRGDLVGWSFGFRDRDVDTHDENGMTTRDVKDLDLREVSILDRRKRPAYDGTLIAVRDDEDVDFLGDEMLTEVEIREMPEEKREDEDPIDYSEYEAIIKEMKEDKTNA